MRTAATSLTQRAIALVLLAELICAVAFSGFALFHERAARLHALDVTLRGRSDSLLGAIQDAEDVDDDVEIDPTELSVPADDRYAVYELGGRRIGQSADAPDELVRRTKNGYSDATLGRRRFRIYQRDAMRVIDRAEHPGLGLRRPVTIVYAVSTDHLWHEVFEAAEFYLILSVVLLMGTAVLMVLFLRRILSPIEDLAAAAASVSTASLAFEAPASAVRVKELQPLADALTSAIGGLREALEKERRFVGDASHELKTAVAVVRSSVQVLMMRARSQSEYAEGLERVLEDGLRVEKLVASMLTLARLESDSGLTCVTTDLSAVVRVCVQKMQTFAEAHEVDLHTELAPSAFVNLAVEKVDVLISNLLSNAVQHSSPGGRVEITTRVADGYGWLRIQDDGDGIGEEALAHVFERFYREDTSRSRSTGGAGLGLAICKAITDGAGGTIEIASSVEKGTVVSVGLRLA